MTRRGLSVAILIGTVSFAAAAAAGDVGPPPDEPEAAPYDDQAPPEAPPPSDAPPVAAVPVAPPAAAAAAGADTGFGFLGQITLSDDLQLLATQQSSSSNGFEQKLTQVQIQPAVDFFAMPNLSIGGKLVLGYMSAETTGNPSNSQTELAIFARGGYTFAFSPTTYLWPRIGLGYDHIGGSLTSSASVSINRIPLEIYIPVVFLPASHFFFGIGPLIRTDLSANADSMGTSVDLPKTTTIGLQSTIGGCVRGM
jgi:hypothetical protein